MLLFIWLLISPFSVSYSFSFAIGASLPTLYIYRVSILGALFGGKILISFTI